MPAWPRSKARSISASVVEAITEKLMRRHPHVFGDQRGALGQGGRGALAADQGRGEGREARRGQERRRPRRRSGRAPCPDPRPQAAAEGRQGRLRLERSARGAGQDPRRGGRDRGRYRRGRRVTARPPKSATCCSRSSTWRGISMPIRKRRCAAPTGNSNGGSRRSKARWRRAARRRSSRRSPKWTRCGTRRRRRRSSGSSPLVGCPPARPREGGDPESQKDSGFPLARE